MAMQIPDVVSRGLHQGRLFLQAAWAQSPSELFIQNNSSEKHTKPRTLCTYFTQWQIQKLINGLGQNGDLWERGSGLQKQGETNTLKE